MNPKVDWFCGVWRHLLMKLRELVFTTDDGDDNNGDDTEWLPGRTLHR